MLTVLPVVNFTNPLLNDWLYLFRGELLLGNTTVIVGVDPLRLKLRTYNMRDHKHHKCSRVESLEILEILSQGFQEQPELPELKVVGTVLIAHPRKGLVSGEVVSPIDGRLAIEQVVTLQDVPNSPVHLKEKGIMIINIRVCSN